MNTVKFATNRIMDSVWTLSYIQCEGGIAIVTHNRTNEVGYEQEGSLPTFKLIEDSVRTVLSATIGGQTHTVLNPGHIFSYSQ